MSIDRIKAGLAQIRQQNGDDWATGAYTEAKPNHPSGFSMGTNSRAQSIKDAMDSMQRIAEKMKEDDTKNKIANIHKALTTLAGPVYNLDLDTMNDSGNLLLSHPDPNFPVTANVDSEDKSPMNIPLLPENLGPEPAWDDPENPPFKTVEELQTQMMVELCRAIDKQPGKLFSIYGAMKFTHRGVTENFVGGEEYRLRHIRRSTDENGQPTLLYWFEAKNAANLKYIHAIPEKEAVKLFGIGEIVEYVARRAQEVGKTEKWNKAKEAIVNRERKEQYAASGVEFGSW